MAKKATTTKPASKRIIVKKADVKKIEDAIEKVDTTIEFEDELTSGKTETPIINTIIETIKDIETSKEELSEKLEKEPDKAEELINEEIKKVEETEHKIEKIIKNREYTDVWNGSQTF